MFSNLFSQEIDSFREHVLRKEREAKERLRREKELNQRLFKSLNKGLRSDDSNIRLRSLKGIMAMENVPGKELLIKDYLDDKVPEIRMAILDYYGERMQPRDAETMLWVVEDENLRVRLKLAETLLKFQNNDIPVYDLISILFEDRQLVVRRRLLEGLLEMPGHRLEPKKTFNMVSSIIYGDTLDLRILALKLVAPFPLAITHDTMEVTLRDPQIPVREFSLEIIGQKMGEKSTKLISERLSDAAISVRKRAIEFLVDRLDENVLRIFENHLLAERDKNLRKQILAGVAKARNLTAVSIISAYLDDPVIEVRRFAAALLDEMRKTINLNLR